VFQGGRKKLPSHSPNPKEKNNLKNQTSSYYITIGTKGKSYQATDPLSKPQNCIRKVSGSSQGSLEQITSQIGS